MKIAFILLAIFASAHSTDFQEFADRSIGGSITGKIEKVRDGMSCGFPSLGIPPIAPFKLADKEVALDTSELKLHGKVQNLVVNNLDNFEVTKMNVKVLTSKVNYELVFRDVNVDTEYELDAMVQRGGLTISAAGKGPAKVLVKEFSMSGTIKYKLNIFSGKLQLKDLSFLPKVNGIESDIQGIFGEAGINEKVNEFLGNTLEQIINQHQDDISDRVEEILLPIINGVLEKKNLFFFIENFAEEKCISA